jgi:uncharacterized delta-60 repeat protein
MPLPITFGAASARGFGLFSALSAGNTSWIGLLGDTGDQVARGIAVDSSNNIYMIGFNAGNHFQLAKYNSAGVIQWQKSLSSAGTDIGNAITIDSSDNIYVTGYVTSGGPYSLQIAKYNSAGNVQWQRSLGGVMFGQALGYATASDIFGNVYAFGEGNTGSNDQFELAKYDATGSIVWQKQLSASPYYMYGRAIATDSAGNIYAGGSVGISSGGTAILIAKYSNFGNVIWQKSLNPDTYGSVNSIAIDSSDNVYAACTIQNTGFSLYRMVILKYDSTGVLQWSRTVGNSNINVSQGIAIDSFDNIYVCGYSSLGGNDSAIILKYNSSGTLQWQRSLGSSASEYASGIAIDGLNNMCISGYTNISGAQDFLFAKLPSDGSLTGTYTVGGYSFTYAASSLVASSSSYTDSATSYIETTTTLPDAASSLTAATTTLTSTVTTL